MHSKCDPKNPQSSCRITVNDHTKNVGMSGTDRGYAFTWKIIVCDKARVAIKLY